MKIQHIHHKDGSESFATNGVTLLKNKERVDEIIITTREAQNFAEAVESIQREDGDNNG